MKAISIRQPWAWLIVNGFKDIENRSWSTNYRGKVLVHTGVARNKHDHQDAHELAKRIVPAILFPEMNELNYGGFVGVADIEDCVDDSDNPWFSGKYGFLLRDAREIPFFPRPGKLGLFEVTVCDILARSLEDK